MAGNVWEYCRDDFDDNYYSISPEKDPVNLPETTALYNKVMRGGSVYDDIGPLRCSARAEANPFDRHSNIGFRVARSLPD